MPQSANAGWVPFGALCRWYLSLVQLTRNGFRGEARFPKFMNCWAQGHSPNVRGPIDCPSIVAVAGRDQAHAYQHPPIEVRCHLAPRTAGILLRFNSFASACWETKPAAISTRMVVAKARARESAPRLFAEAAASIPRLRDEVPPFLAPLGHHGLNLAAAQC